MQGAAPAEAQRRAVRHRRQGLDRLRLCQEPQRARAEIDRVAEVPEGFPAEIVRHRLGRKRRGRQLRHMAVLRHEAGDAAGAEPRAQPVDQPVELGSVLMSRRCRSAPAAHALGDEHREPRQIEAEAGIERDRRARQPLDEEGADRLRIAQRPRGAGIDAAHGAVGAEQRELDMARAVAGGARGPAQPPGEALDGGEHVFLAGDRLGEALLGDIGGDREARG